MSAGQGGAGYGAFEFTVRRSALAALAEWAMAAVPSGVTALPVNGCLQVTVRPGLLQVAAANGQLSVTAESPAVSAATAGLVYLPARKLKAMLSEAAEGDVTVAVKDREAAVTAGGASWKLRLQDPAGYTGIPDLPGAQFAAADREKLLRALSTVRHAVGRDPSRPAFTQVRIAESDGAMYASASDSSQFSQAPAPGFPFPLTVPGAVLDDLVKLLSKSADGAEVADAGSYAVFRSGPVTMAALQTAAPFPDTGGLFLRGVQGNNLDLRVGKDALARALKRVRVNSDAATSAVALLADRDGLTVASRDKPGNSAEETIPAKFTGDGQQLLVVNAAHLEAMLAAHPSPECEFKVGKERGRVRPPLLLEDTEAGVTGICPQMPPAAVGY